ncbi:bromodomain-containing protein 2 [Drosophila takahashii]|uniref:bromodomain-containing protein 2 n=1 Tax=Drosophila takahashii TaxID=29030 RepID=UPI001CF82EDD|nr:bromodomain-containing protein 2 [Drosophila takahashii]
MTALLKNIPALWVFHQAVLHVSKGMSGKQETERASPEINACKAIIKRLFSSSYKNIAWVFYEPLDAQLLGLHDYHEIVKEPMDLSTVRHRVNTGCYQTAADFVKDVRLIFYNTYLYTNPGHLCYEMAKKLQLIFEEMYAQVQLYASNGKRMNGDEEESSSSSSDESESSSSSSSIREDPPEWTPPPVSGSLSQQKPFTTEEDLDFHAKIQQLDGEVLLHVIHLIQRMEGAEYCNKELQFDVRQLKVHTKRSILDYLASKGFTGKRVARTKPKYN